MCLSVCLSIYLLIYTHTHTHTHTYEKPGYVEENEEEKEEEKEEEDAEEEEPVPLTATTSREIDLESGVRGRGDIRGEWKREHRGEPGREWSGGVARDREKEGV